MLDEMPFDVLSNGKTELTAVVVLEFGSSHETIN